MQPDESQTVNIRFGCGKNSRFCCPREVGLGVVQIPLAHAQAGAQSNDRGNEDEKCSHQSKA